ncbi:MAG: hypothetical protein ABIT16_09510 [Croceibacterium sp.]
MTCIHFIGAGALALALAACSAPAPGPEASDAQDTSDASAATAAQATPIPAQPTPVASVDNQAPVLVPDSERGAKGARNVLLTWARALENRNYATAYAQFGQSGPNGASLADYTSWWKRHYKTITVAVPTGDMEGGAGSLYYTAPATLTGETVDGKPYRLKGDVILRRVNDVDGATPDQLRWHIMSADLKAA